MIGVVKIIFGGLLCHSNACPLWRGSEEFIVFALYQDLPGFKNLAGIFHTIKIEVMIYCIGHEVLIVWDACLQQVYLL